MALVVLIQVLLLSAMMLLGYCLGKTGYMNSGHSAFLTKLLLDVFLPCSVISAAGSDFGEGRLSETMAVIAAYLLLMVLFTVVGAGAAKLLRLEGDRALAFRTCVGYPNNAFVGVPLCTAVFGARGTLWAALTIPGTMVYMTVTILIFQREHGGSLKEKLRSLITPINVSTAVMLVLIAARLKLPAPVQSLIGSFSACTTPMAMMIIGFMLSASPLLDALRTPSIYAMTLLRGVLCPLLGALLLSLTPWDRTMCLAIVAVTGCSVAVVVGIFSAQNDRAPEYTGQCILQSSLLLPLTMPLMMLFAERILS